MFTRPADLGDDEVSAALAEGWGIVPDEIRYAPVGFGSHHWIAVAHDRRWFVSVDDLEARRRSHVETRSDADGRLRSALETATALRTHGHDFVVAPIPTVDAEVLRAIDDRYVLAVYPYVDGTTYDFGWYSDDGERNAVLGRLAAIHATTDVVRDLATVDDFLVPGRDQLIQLLDGDADEWGPGPFAAEASALLIARSSTVRSALHRYDQLVDSVSLHSRLVITHGEPHRANTMLTARGVVLIDWDTALLAPVERDLWMLVSEDAAVADRYKMLTGQQVDPDAIELYTLWWDLCEISLYAADLHRPHADSADTQMMWSQFQEYLDPTRWSHR